MKIYILCCVLLTILFTLFCNTNPSFATEKIYKNFTNVIYVRNYDGDTITFNIPNVLPILGDNIPIRVRGIDAPEIRAHCYLEKLKAIEAKKVVHNLCIHAKNITLTEVSRGKYFRIIANVILDGQNLKDTLLKKNLAYEYHGKTKKDWCTILNGEY